MDMEKNKIECSCEDQPEELKGNEELELIPDDNRDEEGRCIYPAYGESIGLNTGGPCDDGRDGD